MNTKFVLRRSVVLAIAFAPGSSALSTNALAARGGLERGHVDVALVIAATSGTPGAIGAPITDLWFTRRLEDGGGRRWRIAAA